jgi:hypothetical protein
VALVLAVLNNGVLQPQCYLINNMDIRKICCEDGTVSGSCPMTDFGIRCIMNLRVCYFSTRYSANIRG